MSQYLNQAAVRRLLREHGRRASRDFLDQVNRVINERLLYAARMHNGGRVTLKADVARHVGFVLVVERKLDETVV